MIPYRSLLSQIPPLVFHRADLYVALGIKDTILIGNFTFLLNNVLVLVGKETEDYFSFARVQKHRIASLKDVLKDKSLRQALFVASNVK